MLFLQDGLWTRLACPSYGFGTSPTARTPTTCATIVRAPRPREHGIVAPLAEDSLKRRFAATRRREGCHVEQPSSPCLSSRIPYGTPVTVGRSSRSSTGRRFERLGPARAISADGASSWGRGARAVMSPVRTTARRPSSAPATSAWSSIRADFGQARRVGAVEPRLTITNSACGSSSRSTAGRRPARSSPRPPRCARSPGAAWVPSRVPSCAQVFGDVEGPGGTRSARRSPAWRAPPRVAHDLGRHRRLPELSGARVVWMSVARAANDAPPRPRAGSEGLGFEVEDGRSGRTSRWRA